MAKYILRFRGTSPAPAEDVARVKASPDVEILDATGRMMLVDGPESAIEKLAASMPGWSLTPEYTIDVPDPRPKPKKSPGEDTEK